MELTHQADRNTLEFQYYEIARDVYQTISKRGSSKFTFSFIDSLWNDLNAAVHDMDRLPEAEFRKLIGIIAGLTEARNELRLARFLFDVEEINPIYRLVMRNRAVLRGKDILRKVLLVWPLQSSSSPHAVDKLAGNPTTDASLLSIGEVFKRKRNES